MNDFDGSDLDNTNYSANEEGFVLARALLLKRVGGGMMNRGFCHLMLMFSFLWGSSVFAGTVPAQLPSKRGPASFTQGYKKVGKRCPIFKSPSLRARHHASISAGNRLWLTAMDSEWFIGVTKKSKRVYIHKSCLI